MSEPVARNMNSQGRMKRAKTESNEAKRQGRIDEIWGVQDGENRRRQSKRDEATAAAEEMRDLTELLLNSLIEARGDGSAAFVTLPKESAAARFLVRANVAEFHPRDASRLRLVDFGREIDD